MDKKSELGKQVASFIIMSVAVSMPAVAMPNDVSNELSTDGIIIANNFVNVNAPAVRYAGPELIMNGSGPVPVPPQIVRYAGPEVITGSGPSPIPQVARYAGPEYFGLSNKTPVNNMDVTKSTNIPDVAQYSQFNNPIYEAGKMKDVKKDTNIDKVKPNSDFVNSEYGSVRVVEPSSGHYIFK